jgi:hypothetical protein
MHGPKEIHARDQSPAQFRELLAHRALNPPPSSSLAEEERLISLLSTQLAAGAGARFARAVCFGAAARDCRRSQLGRARTEVPRYQQSVFLNGQPSQPLLDVTKPVTSDPHLEVAGDRFRQEAGAAPFSRAGSGYDVRLPPPKA